MAETKWGRVLRLLVGLLGVYLALMGLVSVWMLASDSVIEGRVGVAVAGVAFLTAATPALAFPFSRKVAKVLLLIVLSLFAAATLWAVFAPRATPVSITVKMAVLAFAGLLAFRAWLALRASGKQG